MREQVIIGLKPRGESPHLVQVYVAEDDFWLLGARLSRVDSPIQFYGDDIGPDVRLCQGPRLAPGGFFHSSVALGAPYKSALSAGRSGPNLRPSRTVLPQLRCQPFLWGSL
jgi:hypothetical protein